MTASTDEPFTFLGLIQHIKPDTPLVERVSIGRDLYLISDITRVSVLKQRFVQAQFGNLELRHYQKGALFVLGRVQAPTSPEQRERLVFMLADWVVRYLANLWLIRDCSPYVEQCYLLSKTHVHANRAIVHCSCADGLKHDVTFSSEELTRCAKLTFDGEDIMKLVESSDNAGWWRRNETLARRDTTKIERFLGLVHAARRTFDLGLKIAQYCTAIEALLATTTSELRSTLATRVALLFPLEARLEAYKIMQCIYDQRSRVLHGDVVDRKVDLKELSTQADDIARALALHVYVSGDFREMAKSLDSLNTYFLNRTLGLDGSQGFLVLDAPGT